MNVQSDIKIKKNKYHLFLTSMDRLKKSISSYEGRNIRSLHCDSCLIHHKYMIHDACFFTYKTVVRTQQIRMLCYVNAEQNAIVVIKFFLKKKSNSMYHVEFNDYARNYYYTNIF